MQIESAQLGPVEVGEEAVYYFEHGLPGFEEIKRFALLPGRPGSPFRLLQAVDEPALSFAVVDAFFVRPDYAPKLGEADWADLLGVGEVSAGGAVGDAANAADGAGASAAAAGDGNAAGLAHPAGAAGLAGVRSVANGADELEVLAILTLNPDPARITANLQGPVVLHRRTRRGRQVILQEGEYALRHNLLAELNRARQLGMVDVRPSLSVNESVNKKVG